MNKKDVSERILSDSELILRLTDALYGAEKSSHPSYNELRDMMSRGQLKSKSWLVKVLSEKVQLNLINKILIVGSWYGSLAYLIYKYISKEIPIVCIDLDTRCKTFNEVAFYDIPQISFKAADMFNVQYEKNTLIINTACEHLNNLTQWINLIPQESTLLLQSNNLFHCPDHINCSDSIDHFVKQTKLDPKKFQYADELSIGEYKRFMILASL